MALHNEILFELDICNHLAAHGWLYGAPGGNLAADLLDPANARRTFRLATDRVGVPNPVQLVAAEVAGLPLVDPAWELARALAAVAYGSSI